MLWGYDFQFLLQIIARLFLAAILGGIIGYERETENKPAGFRTNMLVCIGSALVMVTSQFLFKEYVSLTNMDPARLGAQVISGIGFIGAGTIIRDGLHVRGLTTAASLWVVACVGLAAGIGFYEGAIACTLFIYLILIAMKKFQDRIKVKNQYRVIVLQSVDEPGQLGAIGAIFGQYSISIKNIDMYKASEMSNSVTIRMTAHITPSTHFLEFMAALKNLRGIDSVSEE